MQSAVERLLSISSEAVVQHVPDSAKIRTIIEPWNFLGTELGRILSIRNGFWAYESSLLVRPFECEKAPLGLVQWNEKNLWKDSYSDDLDHVLFFAEDAFGSQYCLVKNNVCVFDPETSQFESVASSLEEWAQIVIDDYEYRTGYPLAHAWQLESQPLRPGTRLLPKVPFVLGGKYELSNLYLSDDVEGMIFRASISNQIRDVPDGGQVVLRIDDTKRTGGDQK